MKKMIVLAGLFCCGFIQAQDMKKFNLYHPEENAENEMTKAIKEAGEKNKQVFVQIGGNWCVWCARFNEFVTNDPTIDSTIKADYIVYHLNYSKENQNNSLLAKYQFPQRFGFPVFLIVNDKGELLHTENSSYLEEGKGYNKEKILSFLQSWNRKALDPKNYQ